MSKDNIIIVLMFVAVFSIVGNVGQGLYIDGQKESYKGLKEFYESAYEPHESLEPTVTEIPVVTHAYTVEGVYPMANEEGSQGEGVTVRNDLEGIFLDDKTLSKFDLDSNLKRGDIVKVTFEKDNPSNVFGIELIKIK